MDKMREEFEAWVSQFSGQSAIQRRAAWNVWKASRAALCVELPDSWMEHNDAVRGLCELTEQLDKAGVSYK